MCQQLFSSSSIPPRDRNHEKTRQQPSASAATDDDLEREQGQVRYEPESILKSEKFRESLLTQTTTTAEGSSLSSPSVSRLEFLNHVWPQFIRPIVFDLEVSSALLVIDVQNDFISGSLATKDSPAGQDGREVIEPINELLPLFPAVNVVYSLDWHPRNHVSFFSNLDSRDWSSSTSSSGKEEEEEISEWDTVTFSGPPPFNQTLFPDHCVQETLGAQLHSDLKVGKDINKEQQHCE